MPRDYLNDERTRVRRDDRRVTEDAWIVRFLQSAASGTLALSYEDQPFMNTNLFVYDEATHSIIVHTASVGRTRSVIEQNPQASFSVMAMGRLLPAEEALEFSVEYAGVSVFGTMTIIEDEAEATHALQLLLDKYAPHLQAGEDYRPPVPQELKRTAVFRLHINEWAGKKKEVAGHPGAFWYDEAPVLASTRTRHTWNGTLSAIFIAPDKAAPVQACEAVEAIAGQGLRGDRYFDGDGSFSHLAGEGREITLIAWEDIESVRQEASLDLTPEQMRRNLLVRGVPLNYLVGKRFQVGDVVLEGMRLCEPCDTLGKRTGYGNKLIIAMLHRAGLRANIVSGGTIRVGDALRPVTEPEA